jgi:uncharacterized Fe-S cluster protein YjdI/CDGSH-type Zn-finger protein
VSRRLHVYDGATVTVTFAAERCIHSAHCVRNLPEVFDTAARPWVQPDNALAETVLAIVAGCPTGALHATQRDGATAEALVPESPVAIRLTRNGPLEIRGEVTLVDGAEASLGSGRRATLCRCGLSQHKPYCDNSHRAAGWRDTPAAE